MIPVFDLFVDRTQGLLERWQKFCEASKRRSPGELQELQDICLLGIICELTDEVTQGMIEEANQRISKGTK